VPLTQRRAVVTTSIGARFPAANDLVEPERVRDLRGRREAAWQVQAGQRAHLHRDQTGANGNKRRVACSPAVHAQRLLPAGCGHLIVDSAPFSWATPITPAPWAWAGGLFTNRLSLAHVIAATARSLGIKLAQVLDRVEIDALEG